MTTPPRGFDYPLETQRQRMRWRLDDCLGALARSVQALAESRAAQAALDADIAGAAQRGVEPAGCIDIAASRRTLDYLVALRARRARVAATIQGRENDVEAARVALADAQREVDALDRDRDDHLAEFRRDVDRRDARERDQDWIARSSWRDAVIAREGDAR